MDYPDDFETPANPAGKSIAISRTMAIWISVAFLIIISLCFVLVWSYRSQTVKPILISVNESTGQWTTVGKNNEVKQYPVFRTMQEYVVGNFVQEWFTISANKIENDNAWQKCEREKCRDDKLTFGTRTCSLYCFSGEELYSKFLYDIVPEYKSISDSGKSWYVEKESIKIIPTGKISENGGSWRVTATILSNTDETFSIQAFLKIASNKVNYPQTTGFYVADFNAYRMDK